jgi:hypothetical protein
LFGHGEGNKMQLADNIWSAEEKLSKEYNRVLLEPFTEEEVQLL